MSEQVDKAVRRIIEADYKPPAGTGSGWIQWKGTEVCIDLHCKCGHHGHVDARFFYFYECPACHEKFAVGQTVKLIELSPEDLAALADRDFITPEERP